MAYSITVRTGRVSAAILALGVLTACEGFDLDLRGKVGDNFSTAEAARGATQSRPRPDDRGVISYPTYQVAVAKRGDTVGDVAERVGVDASELARFNGIRPDDRLRPGEIIALPGRVAEPTSETGAVPPPSDINITELAGNAIDSADATPPTGATGLAQTGVEPIRHQVAPGETIYTIARLYNVSVRSLADWNALDRSYTLRAGQFLLIPVAVPETPRVAATETVTITEAAAAPLETAAVTQPGAGSRTPEPPSASQPLPTTAPVAAATPAPPPQPQPEPQRIAAAEPVSRDAEMSFPVQGSIIRTYSKGRNDGIDLTASAGAPVKAAASGVVAAITSDANNVPIVIVRHADNLLTVYANIGDIAVKEDDRVSRGQQIGKLRPGSPPYMRFEVRRGFDSQDPMTFLE